MRMLSPLSTEFAWPRRAFPAVELGDVLDDFDRVVQTFLMPTSAQTVNFQPSCDVTESKEHYLVSFDMPGVKKEDMKIEVQGNQLVISGERHSHLRNQKGESTLRVEKRYGKFERSFQLPSSIAADRIEAHYENGVLNVVLPKAETAQGRTIQIQSGQPGFFDRLLGSKKSNESDLKDVKIS